MSRCVSSGIGLENRFQRQVYTIALCKNNAEMYGFCNYNLYVVNHLYRCLTHISGNTLPYSVWPIVMICYSLAAWGDVNIFYVNNLVTEFEMRAKEYTVI